MELLKHNPVDQLGALPKTWIDAINCKPTTALPTPSGQSIPKGSRNTTLNKIGFKMLMEGCSHAAIKAALNAINNEQCQPPLEAPELSSIFSSLKNCKKSPFDSGNEGPLFETPPQQSKMAACLKLKIGDTILFDYVSAEWRQYENGIWRTLHPEELGAYLAYTLDHLIEKGYSESYLTGVIRSLERKYGQTTDDEAKGLIPMLNGVLDPTSKVLHPHSPHHHFTWQLPFNYEPQATSPLTRDWMLQAFNDEDEVVQVVRAFILAILLGRCDIQKFLEIIGPGGTGKTTLIELICRLVGNANIVPTDLKELEHNRFEAAGLHKKKLAVIADSSKYGGTLDKLKAITGQDPLRMERKHRQQGGTFVYSGLVIIAANELIQSLDYTSGLSRRRLTIQMVHRVPEDQRDPDLLHKLCSELPGILNWVLELDWTVAREILRNTAQIGSQVRREAMLQTNPIAAWTDDCLIWDAGAATQIGNLPLDPDTIELKADQWLYVSYVCWCRGHNYRPIAVHRFSSLLIDACQTLGYDVEKYRDAKGAKIRGLRIRRPNDIALPTPVMKFIPPEVGF